MRRSLWKGEGWGGVHGVNKMDTTGTFHVLTQQGLSGRTAGNLKEVGLGWINGGRNDQGFGWGTIRGGGLLQNEENFEFHIQSMS